MNTENQVERWEIIWNRLKGEGWSLGRVRTHQDLIGLVWAVDAVHHETGLQYVAHAPTIGQAMAKIEALMKSEGN